MVFSISSSLRCCYYSFLLPPPLRGLEFFLFFFFFFASVDTIGNSFLFPALGKFVRRLHPIGSVCTSSHIHVKYHPSHLLLLRGWVGARNPLLGLRKSYWGRSAGEIIKPFCIVAHRVRVKVIYSIYKVRITVSPSSARYRRPGGETEEVGGRTVAEEQLSMTIITHFVLALARGVQATGAHRVTHCLIIAEIVTGRESGDVVDLMDMADKLTEAAGHT